MLGEMNVHATLPVSDLERAKAFYKDTLGLEEVGDFEGGVMYRTGDSHVVVYISQFAGTNQGTAASWESNDPEAAVNALKEKGVQFEHYPDLPGVVIEGDLHRMGPMIAAWFKDPDGNILCIGSAL